MSDSEEGSESPQNFEDSRNTWIFLCLVFGISTLVGFALRPLNPYPNAQTTPFPFEPWSTWFMYGFMLLLYIVIVSMAVEDFHEHHKALRRADKVALVLAGLGFTIAAWDTLLGGIFNAYTFDVPYLARSVILTVAGGLFLYGKIRYNQK